VTDTGLLNLRWAHALVDGLAAAGVRRAVISPGSRSTPLVLALDRHPHIATEVLLDERAAAFFALGQAKADGRPGVVVATSGSAPAHWYPALLEAGLSHTPLLLISADRPPELQDWGANQTLDQHGLFGSHVRAFHQAGLPQADDHALRRMRLFAVRAVQQSLWPDPGPVHLNLPFREPLVPDAPEAHWPDATGPEFPLHLPPPALIQSRVGELAQRLNGRPGLILCGPGPCHDDFAHAVTTLARRLGCPLLADPLSGLRFGPWDRSHLLTRYDSWLRRFTRDGLPPLDWLLRFGAAPVSKPLLQYLEDSDSFQVLVTPFGDWPDPGQGSGALLRCDPTAFCRHLAEACDRTGPTETLQTLRTLEATAQPQPPSGAADDRPRAGPLIRSLLHALPAGATLFCGNSLPIRQLDACSGSADKPLHILGNRGASGIDGSAATLAGIAATTPGPVIGLLGDLTLLHDLGGLAAARKLPLTLVVLNNGGGGIFQQLPQARLSGFERYWLTPQGLDLAAAAQLFGLGHRRVERQSQFLPALEYALGRTDPQLIEVLMDPHPVSQQPHTPGQT
jgi:2-succinyl-5-enolpyruvyl-6-hydroxy-3-cyclohexene-1-carboxylate synthase